LSPNVCLATLPILDIVFGSDDHGTLLSTVMQRFAAVRVSLRGGLAV